MDIISPGSLQRGFFLDVVAVRVSPASASWGDVCDILHLRLGIISAHLVQCQG